MCERIMGETLVEVKGWRGQKEIGRLLRQQASVTLVTENGTKRDDVEKFRLPFSSKKAWQSS